MKDVMLKVIEKTGKEMEFEMYLNLFKSLPKMQFAVIKISGQTLEKHIDLIAEDIALLNSLGVFPVVVHGAGTALDKRLPNSKKQDGIRITPPEDMGVIKGVFEDINWQLVSKIKEHGGRAASVTGVFEAVQMPKYGYVGEIKKVEVKDVKSAVEAGLTPVISPLGHNGGFFYNINADTAAKELVAAINPKKFILLTETGGILDESGKILPFLNLSPGCDYGPVTGGMLLKIKEVQEVIKDHKDCAVVITSAENLLKEIFTIKGSGTFIKYYEIDYITDASQIDSFKAKQTLEGAFSKTLADGYFGSGITGAFIEKDYEGIAIMKEVGGMPYLDKFAVAKQAQGTGLGKSLWLEITKKYPKFFLRATLENPFNPFYAKNCDGMAKKNGWTIYWKNMTAQEALLGIEEISEMKKTLTGGEADGHIQSELQVSAEYI